MYRFFEKYNIERKFNSPGIIYAYEDGEPCFKIKCAGVSCIFEFQAYRYIGGMHPQAEYLMTASPQEEISTSFLSIKTILECDNEKRDKEESRECMETCDVVTVMDMDSSPSNEDEVQTVSFIDTDSCPAESEGSSNSCLRVSEV